MKYLLDTNILLRLIEINNPRHQEARRALRVLRQQNHSFTILLQNVSEFWNVCTRPADKNGLGFSVVQTDSHLRRLESLFVVLPDNEDVYKIGEN